LRARVRKLGMISRRLLYTQGVLFLSAAAFFVALVLVRYGQILYPGAN
jgi:hypothetical protein